LADIPITTVTAAVIERDGRVLICRRRPDQDHPGKWEFPGGKLEPGEQPMESLRRELREELSVEATIGSEITRYEYRYAGRKPIRLIFFRVTEFAGELDYSQFDRVAWALPEALPGYDFLEGDVEFVRALAEGTFQSKRHSEPQA
jgi:mutator protein MutT